MPANLELSSDEAETLREILERYLRDLSFEIADTDRSSFRYELKEHRETVRSIARKLP